MPQTIHNFIGGDFSPSQSQNLFTKLSPFTGEKLADVAESELFDLIPAIQMAKKAQSGFENSTLSERADLLEKLASHLEAKSDAYSLWEASHQGLPQSFVLENSLKPSVRLLKSLAQNLRQASEATLLRPTGVIGIITSWSLSLKLVIERLAPALAAGNSCIVKVSELSPITACILGEVCQGAQVPAGLVNVLCGKAEIAAMLAGHPGIRAVTVAGSQKTIEDVARAGVGLLKKLQLSGSAKNGALVLADVDYKMLMPQILRPFLLGQGQLCWNVTRLFVLESFQQDFFAAVTEYLETLQPSRGPQDESPWTPLIESPSLADFADKVQLAKSESGKSLRQERLVSGSGFFQSPIVMKDVPNCSVLQQDPVRGPLLLVTSVKYQHEMSKWVNTSYLSHSSVIWGATEKANKIALKLDSAHVWFNSWMNGEEPTILGHKQSSFGNLDMRWNGSFYSDVKTLTGL